MPGREPRLKTTEGIWVEKCSKKNLAADEAGKGLREKLLGALAG